MKRAKILVPWNEGLHMRPATKLVKSALSYQSSILLKVNERIADARSIFAVLLLSATFGTVVELEVAGDDEEQALAAITLVFELESTESEDGGEGADEKKDTPA
jgi:phosphotransferase system HPr (HPr) family protein